MSRRKRVGVDARTLYGKNLRGIGKSLLELYRGLAERAPQWDFYLYFEKGEERYSHWHDMPGNVVPRPISMKGHRFSLWQNIRLPFELKRDSIDLLHCPAQVSPFFTAVTTVLTVHDIIPLKFDDGWSEKGKEIFASQLRRSVKHADHIITISEYTRHDLLEVFGDSIHDPLEVIHWGAPTATPADSAKAEGYPLPAKPFFYALGGDSPRKNVTRLLEGFAGFSLEHPRWDLVISGLPEASLSQYREMVTRLDNADRVHLLGYIPEQYLNSLMINSSAFIFPSLYEGFGLPILEAMAVGVPLIAASNTSITEVAGDAALYFDGQSVESLAGAMTLFDRLGINERNAMVERGYCRVNKFTWDETVEKTYKIFARYL